MSSRSPRLQDHFADLTDPRRRKVVYPLINIVTIAICAVIAGADDFVSIAAWGGQKRGWLATILDLGSGIPSHDRFKRHLRGAGPRGVREMPAELVSRHFTKSTSGQVVAIDGKTLRGSFDKASGKSAIHMVSAWATANHISLGQVVVDAKSNEITAIPKLLDLLEISGSIVTIDAMGCQTADRRGDRREEGGLRAGGEGESARRCLRGIEVHFLDHLDDDFARVKVSRHETHERGHGPRRASVVLRVRRPGRPSRPGALEGIEANRDRDQ